MGDYPVVRLPVFHHSELLRLASIARPPYLEDDAALLTGLSNALGPGGPGLLAVCGISNLGHLRQALLPYARILALLPPSERSAILKDHGLGTDVSLKDPDRSVSSFAAQLNFGQAQKQSISKNDSVRRKACESTVVQAARSSSTKKFGRFYCPSVSFQLSAGLFESENKLDQLGSLFRQLGQEMLEVGLLVARVCDIIVQKAGLEQAILHSCTAKARLIHYHSLLDKVTFLASSGRNAPDFKKSIFSSAKDLSKELWQQWHFDYGILTVLTAPMFLSSAVGLSVQDKNLESSLSMITRECEPPSGHIGLKILNTGSSRVEFVSVPVDGLVVQVGEAAQILTGGKLLATAHCVCRPPERDDISRETYVLFLQPSWQEALISPKGGDTSALSCNYKHKSEDTLVSLKQEFEEIQMKIPALDCRWREGCSFADFSRETTKQYYGANGAQSRKQ